jgi:hypothetical protein
MIVCKSIYDQDIKNRDWPQAQGRPIQTGSYKIKIKL